MINVLNRHAAIAQLRPSNSICSQAKNFSAQSYSGFIQSKEVHLFWFFLVEEWTYMVDAEQYEWLRRAHVHAHIGVLLNRNTCEWMFGTRAIDIPKLKWQISFGSLLLHKDQFCAMDSVTCTLYSYCRPTYTCTCMRQPVALSIFGLSRHIEGILFPTSFASCHRKKKLFLVQSSVRVSSM